MSNFDNWCAQAKCKLSENARAVGADSHKVAQLTAEFDDHCEIVRQLAVFVAPNLDNENLWEIGYEIASNNATTPGWVAPRSDSEAKQWATRLHTVMFSRFTLYSRSLAVADHYKTFHHVARAFWKSSKWYDKAVLPLRTQESGKAEHNAFKEGLEGGAIEEFLRVYNAASDQPYSLVTVGDSPGEGRPDTVLRDSQGKEIGVEIVTVIYGDEAKILKGKSPSPQTSPKSLTAQFDGQPSLVEKLNRELKNKAGKRANYSTHERVNLLVRVATPQFGAAQFTAQLEAGAIVVPRGLFQNIWLLLWDQGQWRVLTLD